MQVRHTISTNEDVQFGARHMISTNDIYQKFNLVNILGKIAYLET